MAIDRQLRHATLTRILISDQLKSAPQPPQNLVIDATGGATVDLNWDDLAVPPDSYTAYIYNETDGALEQTVTGLSMSEAEIMGLSEGDDYRAWVTAVTDGIEGENSNEVTFTPSQAPEAPTGLVASPGDSLVGLDWDDNAEGDLAGYNVYVDAGQGGGFVKENTTLITNSTYQVSGLTNDQEYDFKVTAVDNIGNESADSSTVSATPESAGLDNLKSSKFTDGSYIETHEVNMFGENEVSIFCYLTIDEIVSTFSNHNTIWGSFNDTGDERFYFSHSTQFGSRCWGLGMGDNFEFASSDDYPVEVGKLYFACVTINKTLDEAKLYLNGKHVLTNEYSNEDLMEDNAFVIGARDERDDSGGIVEFFGGKIDELFVLSRAVTLSEYRSFYWKGLKIEQDSDLIHHWKLDTQSSPDEVDGTDATTVNSITLEDPLLAPDEFPALLFEGIYSFESLSLPMGDTVNVEGNCRLLVSGDVSIAGTLDGDGGGFGGGTQDFDDGEGPGAGLGQVNDGGTGASYGGQGGTAPDAESTPPDPYDDANLDGVQAGSGGGGGDNTSTNDGLGGAGGAGLAIIAEGDVDISGTIRVNGFDGGDGGSQFRGGGGGSGGGIVLLGNEVTIQSGASLLANGGDGGISGTTSDFNDCGGGGGGGRIKLFYVTSLTNSGTIEVSGGQVSDGSQADYNGDDGQSVTGQVFETDFGEYSAGSPPPDWSTEWDGGTWAVQGGGGDQWVANSTDNEDLLRWGDLPAAFTDGEFLIRGRTTNGGSNTRIGVAGRADNPKEGYYAEWDARSGGLLRINLYDNSSFSELDTFSFASADNDWFWIRFKIVGDQLTARIWADGDTEPTFWNLEVANSALTGAGFSGLFSFGGNSEFSDYRAIAID